MTIGRGKSVFLGAVGALAALTSAAWPFAAFSQDLDLVNVTLIDGTGAAPRKGVAVSVRGGKIATIATSAPAPVAGVRRIELGGRYLLPGLIDAHAHIESPAAALRALQSGVTTARVLGDTYLQAMGTRNLIRAGHVPGPELLVSPGHIPPEAGPGVLHGVSATGRRHRRRTPRSRPNCGSYERTDRTRRGRHQGRRQRTGGAREY